MRLADTETGNDMAEENKKYSPDNWAHQALLLMDEVDALVRWAAVSHPDPEKYKSAAKAFWDVCHMLAEERIVRAAVRHKAGALLRGPDA